LLFHGDDVVEVSGAVIDQSIRLEQNVAELYLLFSKIFPEDASFWWQFCLEERNHAALIRSAKEYFAQVDRLPERLFCADVKLLEETNSRLRSLLVRYRENAPDRTEAFNCAVSIENSAGELHYQAFMHWPPESKVDEVLSKLNRDDKDHAERLCAYMSEQSIPLERGFE